MNEMTSKTTSYFSRKCSYCGKVFSAQEAESNGPAFRAMDSMGRMQSHRTSKTADAMPAYILRHIHERDCFAK
jgi:hypothetical protein